MVKALVVRIVEGAGFFDMLVFIIIMRSDVFRFSLREILCPHYIPAVLTWRSVLLVCFFYIQFIDVYQQSFGFSDAFCLFLLMRLHRILMMTRRVVLSIYCIAVLLLPLIYSVRRKAPVDNAPCIC